MKKSILALALPFVVAAACPPAFAGRADVGTSGAVFLKLNAGSRPAGMGEAFAGVADDVNSVFYNPAGSAFLEKVEFTAQYGSWFQEIKYNALGFVYPTSSAGSFGLGVINLGVSDIERRAGDTVDPDGLFDASDFAYILHYSKALGKRLAAGVNAKLISQKLDDKSATSYGGDAGVLWKTPVTGLAAGLAVQNLGTSVKFDEVADPLPLNIKSGVGYSWKMDSRSLVTAALDANMPRDNDMLYSAGAELRREFGKEM